MKTWEKCEVVEMNVADTAFGPIAPENPDSEKTAVLDENGKLLGWKQKFGEEDNASGATR